METTLNISISQLEEWSRRPEISAEASLVVSVVIVHYNVPDYLARCLRSLHRALQRLPAEIIVIDNASPDRSWVKLQDTFPTVQWIALPENIGFGRANNIGFSLARGQYILCLNPDAVVGEDTIERLVHDMEHHRDVGVVGCRVLNPDGSLQLACRRSFPTPFVALTRLLGLQQLFPRSRLFARYNLTFLDENQSADVDVLSGSCMMFRRQALRQVGGFDPQFFLYGEDIDICYRVKQQGWRVRYLADATVVHFKGASTRRSLLDKTRMFYEAMEIFARKHFAHYRWFYRLIRWGIWLGERLSRVWTYRKALGFLLLDLVIANTALLVSTAFRFGTPFGFPDYAYPGVFIVLSLIIGITLFFVGEYSPLEQPSAYRSLVGVMFAFFVLAALTYFFKDFAFSRGVLLMTIGIAAFSIPASRFIYFLRQVVVRSHRPQRIAIIGTGAKAQLLAQRFVEREGRKATVVGLIAPVPEADLGDVKIPLLGTIQQLETIVQQYGVTTVVVTAVVPYSQMIALMRTLAPREVNFYFAHDYDEVAIERVIEEVTGRRGDIWRIMLPRYRVVKRLMDMLIAAFCLTIGLPIVNLLFGNQGRQKLWAVLRGAKSIVGVYRLYPQQLLPFKEGLISLVHLQEQTMLTERVVEALNAYYVREYTLALDVEIGIRFIGQRILWKRETRT